MRRADVAPLGRADVAPIVRPTPDEAKSAIQTPAAVSFRSIALGLALIPPNIVWVVLMERVDGRAFSTTISLFFTAAFTLLVLTAVNAAIRRRWPRRALRRGELLTIFSMVSIATAMAGVDLGSPLMTVMAHGFWFATPENGWEHTFWAYLPRWLTVSDREALRGYYLGNSSLYRAVALRAWLPPLGAWCAFLMGLLWVMACLNALLRAQWTDKERLTYPIAQLPIAVTDESGALFRSRLFWMGFALSGSLSLVNGLHNLIPSVPALTFNGFDALQWFPARPWNAIGWTPLAVFPFIVGLGYLLPVDLLFSCWFFFLFWRMEKVTASALGYMAEQPKFPYVDEQMFGGYMAVCAFAIWGARAHLSDTWRRAFGGRERPDSAASYDPLSYRAAWIGLIGGIVFLLAFACAAGLPLWLAAAFFLIYFAIAIAVTRMRAELGPPAHDLHFIGPDQSLTSVFGTRGMPGPALGVFTLFYWFNRAYRCHPMPHHLEGCKMAQVSGTSARGLLLAMGLAALAGYVATCWTTLHVSYVMGAAGRIHGWSSLGFGSEAYNRLSGWITTPTRPEPNAAVAMGIGYIIASVLTILRTRIYGWPFHALGFSLSGGWSMQWVWLSLFVAWILKSLILRYGGLRAYRAGLPFFFGIIAGDFITGGSWTILALLFDMPLYSLWSG